MPYFHWYQSHLDWNNLSNSELITLSINIGSFTLWLPYWILNYVWTSFLSYKNMYIINYIFSFMFTKIIPLVPNPVKRRADKTCLYFPIPSRDGLEKKLPLLPNPVSRRASNLSSTSQSRLETGSIETVTTFLSFNIFSFFFQHLLKSVLTTCR